MVSGIMHQLRASRGQANGESLTLAAWRTVVRRDSSEKKTMINKCNLLWGRKGYLVCSRNFPFPYIDSLGMGWPCASSFDLPQAYGSFILF